MVVLALRRQNRRVPQSVPHVVERVVVLDAQHPPGDRVPERVGGDVVGPAAPGERVGPDVGGLGHPLHGVVDRLPGQPRALLRGEQRRVVVVALLEVGLERRDDVELLAAVELERRRLSSSSLIIEITV